MSQADVLEALEKVDEGLSADELADIIDVNTAAIRKCLNRLLKSREVERIQLNKQQIEKLNKSFSGRHYKWKIKIEYE